MPPKGKSKALALKHSYLGQFTKNARKLEDIKSLMVEQERTITELEERRTELDKTIQQQQSEISSKQKDIKKTRRKLDHKKTTLENIAQKLKNVDLQLTKLAPTRIKLNTAFSISKKVQKQRKLKPSKKELSHSTKSVRRSETFQACKAIHGATCENLNPLVTGMMDTLSSKVSPKVLSQCILSGKQSVVNQIENYVISRWKNEYYQSDENILKSLNVYYGQDVMGKAKYKATRKANRSRSVPNFVPYATLSEYIRKIDIGRIIDVKENYGGGIVNEEPADGVCRRLSEYAVRLAKFYIHVNEQRIDKLLDFESFEKKNPQSILFVMAIGGDGAPATGTAILVSFLNVANRIASSSENFLLFGANVPETATVVRHYIKELISDVQYLEKEVFNLTVNKKTFSVEFKLGEIPNDMKMLCFLAGELSNAALYFSTFANVNSKNSNDITKKIGQGKDDWQLFQYSKRLENAEKVSKKEKEFADSKTAKLTQRSKLTTYIGKILQCRQYEVPLVAHYVDRAKAEPLHLKNNVVKEMFLKLLMVCATQSNLKNLKKFKEIPDKELLVTFVSHIRTEMHCKYLSKKIIQWFDESNGKLESDFSFRFRGKESFAFLKHFPELIHMIIHSTSMEAVVIQLRHIISYSVRVTHFDESILKNMKACCSKLFKSRSLTEDHISPSLWTLCNAAPYHAELTLKEYGLGLGINTMEGREQKHQAISKYSNNTTVQNRWPMIFRHEFLQLIHLRENGFDNLYYRKRPKKYVPVFSQNECQKCGMKLVNKVCSICDSQYMTKVMKEIEV